jgi:hypothetical protein
MAKPTAKKMTKKAAKIARPAAKAKAPAKAAAKPAAKAAVAKTAMAMECCGEDGCRCGIPAHRFGSLCRCHLFALLCQKKTLGVWLIAFAVLLSAGSFLMPLPEAVRPLLFHIGNHAVTALAFALLFRLGFTGCGGCIEGGKLGMIIFLPLASLTVLLTLASIPPFMPLMGTGIIGAVLAAGSLYLVLGILAGALCGWYLKPCCCNK